MAGASERSGWDFFISYNQADRPWAEWIAWQLEDAGYQVLVQAWDFVAGTNWTIRMAEGIEHATRTIAVISPAYLTSDFGRQEWMAAFRADPTGFKRKLLPIRVEDCDRPTLLESVVSFDLFDQSPEEARRRLLEEVRRALAGRAKPVIEPEFPVLARTAPPGDEPRFPDRPIATATATATAGDSQPRVTELPRHSAGAWSLAFSPQREILAAGYRDGAVCLWDINRQTGPRMIESLPTNHSNTVVSVAFAPDGRTLATAAGGLERRGQQRLWDVGDPEEPHLVAELTGHARAAKSVAFSPVGAVLATANSDKNVRLWDVEKPTQPNLLATLRNRTKYFTGRLRSVAFSADGRTLATVDNEGTTRLWDVSDSRRPGAIAVSGKKFFDGGLHSVAFSSNGRTLAIGGEITTVRLLDISEPVQLRAVAKPRRDHGGVVWSVAFSPDGRTLASGSRDKTVRLWDTSDPALLRPTADPVRQHPEKVRSVAFSPDGKTLATGCQDGIVRLFQIGR
ncbi:TIR domain-containing protein [Frankia sp. QA3]|uniref:toll/interleukin-1 receptor domain-containing protein n=1 Tax=Frankia sp. QA3 TaxID=710111 RepID=UPI000269C009|nr:TIR domain-containing protein [Frankia sp. QA3]EIV92971.1 WD40 repeat-containing protein [Frankia sp. QA3]